MLLATVYLILWAPAWLLPASWWPAVTRGLALVVSALRGGRAGRFGELVPAPVFARVAASASLAARRLDAGDFSERMELLREQRPGGWWPRATLVGGEPLAEVIAVGRGAIVWVTPCVSSAVVAKLALRDAGYTVTHLSRADHGLARSRLGVRFLNRLQVRVEERLVRERIEMRGRGAVPVAQMRRLRERLAENQVVTITVTAGGQQQVRVPFLDRALELPTGAINLARASGATLLPGFTIEVGPSAYRLALGAPLDVAPGEPREVGFATAAGAYARQLEAFVHAHPAAWRGWRYPVVKAGVSDSATPAGVADEK